MMAICASGATARRGSEDLAEVSLVGAEHCLNRVDTAGPNGLIR